VVQVDHVDGVDGGAGVGVGGEQHAAGPGVDVHRVLEELDAVHVRHPVVGQDHGDLVAAQLQFAQRFQGRFPGLGPDDAVLAAVLAPQVAGDGAGDVRVVVNGDDRGPRVVGAGVGRGQGHECSVGSSGPGGGPGAPRPRSGRMQTS
jgi:hypothetical protein